MKATILLIALLSLTVSKTIFNVHLESVLFQIEANDGQPLKITYPTGDEITFILASWNYTPRADLTAYCMKFNEEYITFCQWDKNDINQDMATFFSVTIDYHKRSPLYADFSIWTKDSATVPTEQQFKDNIAKMTNKFIDYDQDGLVFLK
jgi:hypothetical protein